MYTTSFLDQISITNIGLYLIIGVRVAFIINTLLIDYKGALFNSKSLVFSFITKSNKGKISRIDVKERHIYFLYIFIYALFVFILVNNLIGISPHSFALISHFLLTLLVSFPIVLTFYIYITVMSNNLCLNQVTRQNTMARKAAGLINVKKRQVLLNSVSFRRYYSKSSVTSTEDNKKGNLFFSNVDTDKLEILKVSKNMSGIYMWTNNLNGKKYIGSSVNLRRRFLEYFNTNRLLRVSSMPICAALLKHGFSNFSLEILEVCDSDKLMFWEKHYFNLYSPEYNILENPGNPSKGKGWYHSEAAREKMKLAALNRSHEDLTRLSLSQTSGKKVEVTDVTTGTKTVYHAIRAASRALSIDKRYIENYIYLNQEKPVLGKYIFKFIGEISNNLNVSIQKTSKSLEVTDVEINVTTIYPSVSSAARTLGIRQASISLYLKDARTKPFKGKYIFKLV